MSVSVFLRINTDIILTGDAIHANQCLVLAEMKVRDWIVGKLSIRKPQILYSTYVNDR